MLNHKRLPTPPIETLKEDSNPGTVTAASRSGLHLVCDSPNEHPDSKNCSETPRYRVQAPSPGVTGGSDGFNPSASVRKT